MSRTPEATGPKITSLDGLRGLAVLAVMLHHNVNSQTDGNLVVRIVNKGFYLGWIGVDLFFVLSGFLITGILLNTRNCRNYFSSFWCRRALRIFPLSYGFLLVALVVFPHIVSPDWLPAKADYWLYPTYLMNWLPLWHEPWHANVLGPFWSLCIEEQFYLVWPLIVLAVNPRALPRVLLMLELLVIAVRGWWVWNYGPNEFIELTRADGLLAGALCACVLYQQRITRRTTSMLGFVAVISFSGFAAVYATAGDVRWNVFVEAAGFSVLALSFSALLLYAVQADHESGWLQTILRCKPLTSLGKISYGIYIFHVPLFYLVNYHVAFPAFLVELPGFRYLLIAIKCFLCVGIASLSFAYFERPFLLLKDRFKPEYSPIREANVAAAN